MAVWRGLGRDVAGHVVDIVADRLSASAGAYPWHRLLALVASRNPALRAIVPHALLRVLTSNPTLAPSFSTHATLALLPLLNAIPDDLAISTRDLLLALCQDQAALLEMLAQPVVRNLVDMHQVGNNQAGEVLAVFRGQCMHPDFMPRIRELADMPARFKTLPPGFEIEALTSLALMSNSKLSLKTLVDARLFTRVLPELLESSDTELRVRAGF